MHANELQSGARGLADAELHPSVSREARQGAGKYYPRLPSTAHQWWSAAAWIGGVIVFFAVVLRISLSFPVDSDAANNVLQASDILHGNLLLHGWIVGDATYYTFELPLYVIIVALFGAHAIVPHIVSAFVYTVVGVCAAVVARTGSRGTSAWIRTAVVVAVLAAPLLTAAGVSLAVEKPDHTGTSAIMLVAFLLIDRRPSWRLTAPLLCLLLCLGELSDATVTYVAVPAIVLVCIYRAVTARRIRGADTAIAVAALVSVPLSMLIQALLAHLGGYWMISPQNKLAGFSQLQHNAWLSVRAIGVLFSDFSTAGPAPLGPVGYILGWTFLVAAAVGFLRVVRTWPRATRAEQFICVAVVVNFCAYLFSTIPVPSNSRELVALVPFGAILAARCVPSRIAVGLRARTAILAGAVVAVILPLAGAASLPTGTPKDAALATWLEAHGLKYGVGSYWNASEITLLSGGKVHVIAETPTSAGISAFDWEAKAFWYDPSKHYATFAIANEGTRVNRTSLPLYIYEQYLGTPAQIHKVGGRLVLVYHENLLRYLKHPFPIPPPPGSTPKAGQHHRR